eukprot:gene11458-34168_t
MFPLPAFGSRKAELKPPDCIARYFVTKYSWRGKYRRILAITPTEILTQDPAGNLACTNSYHIWGDPDIDGIQISSGNDDEAEFTLSCRGDKKSKFKAVKFSCRQRTQLLTDLYQCLAAGLAAGKCAIAAKLLGSPDNFSGHEWTSKGWLPVTLRITCYGLEALDRSGSIQWRGEFGGMSTDPSIAFLSSHNPAAAALGAASSNLMGTPAAPEGGAAFSVHMRFKHMPKVFASRQRDALVQLVQKTAAKRLGVQLPVDSSSKRSVDELLTAAVAAEQSAASELPLGEWQSATLVPTYPLIGAPSTGGRQVGDRWATAPSTQRDPGANLSPIERDPHRARPWCQPFPPSFGGHRRLPHRARHRVAGTYEEMSVAPGANLSPRRFVVTATSLIERDADVKCPSPPVQTYPPRRLVVTATSLIERDADTYEVDERHPHSALAALISFIEDPKLLGIEWVGGAKPTTYMTPDRDTVLVVLMDAVQGDRAGGAHGVQAATGAQWPSYLATPAPGDPVAGGLSSGSIPVGHSTSIYRDVELERCYIDLMTLRGKEAYEGLVKSGRSFYTADIEFSDLAWPHQRFSFTGQVGGLSSTGVGAGGGFSSPSNNSLTMTGPAGGGSGVAAAVRNLSQGPPHE